MASHYRSETIDKSNERFKTHKRLQVSGIIMSRTLNNKLQIANIIFLMYYFIYFFKSPKSIQSELDFFCQ